MANSPTARTKLSESGTLRWKSVKDTINHYDIVSQVKGASGKTRKGTWATRAREIGIGRAERGQSGMVLGIGQSDHKNYALYALPPRSIFVLYWPDESTDTIEPIDLTWDQVAL